MNTDLLLEALQEEAPSLAPRIDHIPIQETCMSLDTVWLRPVVELLVRRFGVAHLSTITGEDTGSHIELLYHFWEGGGGLTLRLELTREEPAVPSVRDLIPGAAFYEREIIEMLGVRIGGYENLGPLLLPDDWTGPPPMRRTEGDPS